MYMYVTYTNKANDQKTMQLTVTETEFNSCFDFA